MALLEVKDLSIRFGGLTAVDQVNFSVEKESITGLIGPNGAGKTTIFNLLTNVYQPSEGSILLDGQSSIKKHPHQAVGLGFSRTFQNIRLFKHMTVRDNIKVAFLRRGTYGIATGILRLPKYWEQEARFNAKVDELLAVFQMEKTAELLAGNLPYGQQRKLEIARALATDPKLLLLDEPAAGMNPTETKELMDNIRQLRDHFKVSVLLIEHDMKLVMGLCERIIVLNYGRVIADGSPRDVRRSKEVIRAYLGGES